ncbi:hypothetical protein AtNW77_Chr5g0099701 [Arabidopsis thaliana]|uniref:Transmembrane protein n=2 Tax=Arabidopsis thaliana TaxID=3702 RepID=A0A654G1J1_ARATH|nr:uncharacterized protein AT5G15843 [Arabidopsis thaliana]ANM68201.1 transmembrane protein [Arabidopsis thaliana]CAA0402859.1 unnamed protein product [Arabidopsis thaliana]VYS66957.1 unnamed protein product [Arabidopsis thaliana]|eukprot:NP_001329974.1 transmembrane protein [Arabidopsis thaliana]
MADGRRESVTCSGYREEYQNEGTIPYPVLYISIVLNPCSSASISLFANRPLTRGLISAYAFLEAYLIVFSNFLVFLFSLYLRTLASLSIGLSCVTVIIWLAGSGCCSTVPLGVLGCEAVVTHAVDSGTTPVSMDEILLVKFLCAIDQLLAVDQWICVYDERIHPAALWEDAKLKGEQPRSNLLGILITFFTFLLIHHQSLLWIGHCFLALVVSSGHGAERVSRNW